MILAIKAIPTLFGCGNPLPKVMICLGALVLLTFSSCTDNEDNPVIEPEPADMVRLVSTKNEAVYGPFTITTLVSNEWENGRLIAPGFTPTYENGRLVTLVKDNGTDNTYFTYDDGTGQR